MRRGSVYRRARWHCATCGKRRDILADRKACEAAGHTVEQRMSAEFWIKYVRGGRSYAQNSECTTKREAEKKLTEVMGDIDGGRPISNKTGKVKFSEAAEDLLANYKSHGRKSTAEVDRRLRLHLTPYFGDWRMANITEADVDKFVAKRQSEETVLVKRERRNADGTVTPAVRKPASNAEINRELAILKRMFALCIRSRKLMYKPHISMRRESAPRAGFFEFDQYESLLRHLPAEVQPVIAFAYITGWRINSEVLTLEWNRVDFKAGEVRLGADHSKNAEGRVFPMNADLRTLLEAQQKEHERLKKAGVICPYVFFREDEEDGKLKPVPIKSFKKAWKTAVLKAGCPGRIPHDLRRTAVRRLVRGGIPERVAMRMTGHKTASVFKRYDIVSGDDYLDAARKLDVAMLAERTGRNAG